MEKTIKKMPLPDKAKINEWKKVNQLSKSFIYGSKILEPITNEHTPIKKEATICNELDETTNMQIQLLKNIVKDISKTTSTTLETQTHLIHKMKTIRDKMQEEMKEMASSSKMLECLYHDRDVV